MAARLQGPMRPTGLPHAIKVSGLWGNGDHFVELSRACAIGSNWNSSGQWLVSRKPLKQKTFSDPTLAGQLIDESNPVWYHRSTCTCQSLNSCQIVYLWKANVDQHIAHYVGKSCFQLSSPQSGLKSNLVLAQMACPKKYLCCEPREFINCQQFVSGVRNFWGRNWGIRGGMIEVNLAWNQGPSQAGAATGSSDCQPGLCYLAFLEFFTRLRPFMLTLGYCKLQLKKVTLIKLDWKFSLHRLGKKVFDLALLPSYSTP